MELISRVIGVGVGDDVGDGVLLVVLIVFNVLVKVPFTHPENVKMRNKTKRRVSMFLICLYIS